MLEPVSQKLPSSTSAELPATTPIDGQNTLEVLGGEDSTEEVNIIPELEAHLDQLPEQDKAFLAEHMTQEFVRAIGLINGPEVAQYFAQFVDPNKLLVPVPRQIAEQFLAEQNSRQQPSAAQGPSAPSPNVQPQAAPQGGLMTPKM